MKRKATMKVTTESWEKWQEISLLQGCYAELKDWAEEHSWLFIVICVIIALIQVSIILGRQEYSQENTIWFRIAGDPPLMKRRRNEIESKRLFQQEGQTETKKKVMLEEKCCKAFELFVLSEWRNLSSQLSLWFCLQICGVIFACYMCNAIKERG